MLFRFGFPVNILRIKNSLKSNLGIQSITLKKNNSDYYSFMNLDEKF